MENTPPDQKIAPASASGSVYGDSQPGNFKNIVTGILIFFVIVSLVYAAYWYGKHINMTRELSPNLSAEPSPIVKEITGDVTPTPADGTINPISFYDFSGVLELTGYMTIMERSCAFVEDDSCKVKLAVFHVLKADNPNFGSFLKDLSGNSFATDDGIILGCIDEAKRQITSSNDADSGTVDNLVTGSQYDLLMGGSREEPVKLSAEKPRLTGGRGAPDCYAHFRNFKVY